MNREPPALVTRAAPERKDRRLLRKELYHMGRKKTSGGVRGPRGPYALDSIRDDDVLDDWQRLAFGIVTQAVEDAKKINARGGDELHNANGALLATREELRIFFSSRWCAVLLHECDLTGAEIAGRVGL